ncbi:cytochrome b/b6 domain-containing protein [Methylobacterium oryzisoli]|uniref:cytochrome b/b6 domain-containing protein n=1 Tax=Methylobacterium oryzisoli TaxID=3385502 RepID=UPI003891D901
MSAKGIQTHAWPLRLAHWTMAIAILVMIGSGWRIYNAEPILPFRFPLALTLGGDVEAALARHGDPGVATAIAWHFAGMWLLGAAFGLFLLHGLISGHFRRDYLPLTPRAFLRDFSDALRFRLEHRLGVYNAVQKAFYWCVILALVVVILSGIAIWKPVQTYPLETLFGGFQGARTVHFLAMTAIAGFLVIHLALVAIVPSTLVAMITGRSGSSPAPEGDAP